MEYSVGMVVGMYAVRCPVEYVNKDHPHVVEVMIAVPTPLFIVVDVIVDSIMHHAEEQQLQHRP